LSRSPRLPNMARRSIPVAVPAPTQLPLALRWEHPVDRVTMRHEPEPDAPTLLVQRMRRAA
jgi:hypothetical protein